MDGRASIVTYAAREIEGRDAVLRAWMPLAGVGGWKQVLDATFADDADLHRSRDAIVVNALGRGRTLPNERLEAPALTSSIWLRSWLSANGSSNRRGWTGDPFRFG